MKLYTFTIAQNISPGKLYPYVRRMLPELPEYVIREAFQKRDVKVNGLRVDKGAELMPGAEVRLYARDTDGQALRIIYQDENLMVVIKPVGISCEPDSKGGKTIIELAWDALKQDDPNAPAPMLCHRLDNQTDGLLLMAKTERVREALEGAFRERSIHKTYTCAVIGTPTPPHRVLEGWLVKDAMRASVRVFSRERPGALSIVTEYEVVKAGECARLRVSPHTGRTHQIRAHMAFIGHPLLGDDKYGDRAFNRAKRAKRLMLSATGLSFSLQGALSYLNSKTFSFTPEF